MPKAGVTIMHGRKGKLLLAILLSAAFVFGGICVGLTLPHIAGIAHTPIRRSGANRTVEANVEPEEPEVEIVPVIEVTCAPADVPGSMAIMALYQGDYPEPVCRVNGASRSVASSGCGAVCVSMVVSYLTGNAEQTPDVVFRSAVDKGDYFGYGLTHETLSELLQENGVNSEWILNDADAITQALRAGKPVIAHMGRGTFTNGGHYIVLRGITDDDQVLVNDPASPERTEETYPIDLLIKQARRADSFLICWTDGPMPTPKPRPALIVAANKMQGAN